MVPRPSSGEDPSPQLSRRRTVLAALAGAVGVILAGAGEIVIREVTEHQRWKR